MRAALKRPTRAKTYPITSPKNAGYFLCIEASLGVDHPGLLYIYALLALYVNAISFAYFDFYGRLTGVNNCILLMPLSLYLRLCLVYQFFFFYFSKMLHVHYIDET